MFGHGESKLNQTTQILLMLFARTCHIVPKSRSTSGVNRKKEPSFQLRQRFFQIIAGGLRQIQFFLLRTIITTTTTPQKLFPRYHHASRMMTHSAMRWSLKRFSNWQKVMGWGRCWTPSRTSQNHLVFAQHFPQNHQSLLSSMPKKNIQ